MIRRFINKINNMSWPWPAGAPLPASSFNRNTAEIYIDALEESSLTPELIMLRSTWL